MEKLNVKTQMLKDTCKRKGEENECFGEVFFFFINEVSFSVLKIIYF